jgi:hypothetical protein
MPPLDKAAFERAFVRSAEAVPASENGERDPAVGELWSLIEPRLEEKGRFESELRDHLKETTKDVKSWRGFRRLSTLFAIGIVALATLTLGFILFCPTSPVTLTTVKSDSVRIALLSGPFAIIFGLTALILRGAFTAHRPQESAIPMPEHSKLLSEAVAGIFSHKA